MKKNKEKKTILGLSPLYAIALIVFLIALVLCYIVITYYKIEDKNNVPTAIVITTNANKTYVQTVDLKDAIGDFILDHEYFAADEDALNFDAENIDKEIDEIEKLIELSEIEIKDVEKKDKISKQEQVKKVIADLHKVKKPLVAVVIDDMGINKKRTLDIISIKAPLTSSFLTYGNNLSELAQKAQEAGHEIMIHAPMEPKVAASLAPDTLKTDMNKAQIEDLFMQMLGKFENIKVSGVNNHMGSKFTEDKERLGYVMNLLKNKDMFFLDSKTTSISKGKELAHENGVDFAQRDVFLDNENNYDYIFAQLEKTETIATKKGFAVAICHPKSHTYQALKDWVEGLKDKNIELVHVSKIVEFVNKK